MTDSTGTETDSKPSRRLLRLSVRTLMVAVLVLGLTLSWLVRRARVQRDAVEAIERTGGSVVYDWGRIPGKGLNPQGKPPWPLWLVDRLGADYFGNVAIVTLGRKADDAVMEQVGRLSHLESFSCFAGRRGVTDAGMAHLRRLVDLESIVLSKSKVTGACLKDLRNLPKLKELYLRDTYLSDPHLAHLQGLTSLESLDISQTLVTDAGLIELGALKSTLRHLVLNHTKITDAGASAIVALENLTSLFLSDTAITDATLDRLAGLKKLRMIVVDRTDVSVDGIVRLRDVIPRLKTYPIINVVTRASTPSANPPTSGANPP